MALSKKERLISNYSKGQGLSRSELGVSVSTEKQTFRDRPAPVEVKNCIEGSRGVSLSRQEATADEIEKQLEVSRLPTLLHKWVATTGLSRREMENNKYS